MQQPLEDAAWDIDGTGELSQSIMYSVIRTESQFYTQAISPAGALGLFQFLPTSFEALDNNWKLLAESGVNSYVKYLLDPAKNVQLWARWVAGEFPINKRDSVALALMKHQAGPGNVLGWSSTYWSKLGREDDLEYRIETARFNETRNFVRQVLRDTTIIEAAEFSKTPSGN